MLMRADKLKQPLSRDHWSLLAWSHHDVVVHKLFIIHASCCSDVSLQGNAEAPIQLHVMLLQLLVMLAAEDTIMQKVHFYMWFLSSFMLYSVICYFVCVVCHIHCGIYVVFCSSPHHLQGLFRILLKGGQMSSANILGGGIHAYILQGGASQFSRGGGGGGGKSITRGPPEINPDYPCTCMYLVHLCSWPFHSLWSQTNRREVYIFLWTVYSCPS